MPRHLVLEVVLPMHDGDELMTLVDDDRPESLTIQMAEALGIVDNRLQVVWLIDHDDDYAADEHRQGPHMHAEPGMLLKIRLDDEQWVDFTAGREFGGGGGN